MCESFLNIGVFDCYELIFKELDIHSLLILRSTCKEMKICVDAYMKTDNKIVEEIYITNRISNICLTDYSALTLNVIRKYNFLDICMDIIYFYDNVKFTNETQVNINNLLLNTVSEYNFSLNKNIKINQLILSDELKNFLFDGNYKIKLNYDVLYKEESIWYRDIDLISIQECDNNKYKYYSYSKYNNFIADIYHNVELQNLENLLISMPSNFPVFDISLLNSLKRLNSLTLLDLETIKGTNNSLKKIYLDTCKYLDLNVATMESLEELYFKGKYIVNLDKVSRLLRVLNTNSKLIMREYETLPELDKLYLYNVKDNMSCETEYKSLSINRIGFTYIAVEKNISFTYMFNNCHEVLLDLDYHSREHGEINIINSFYNCYRLNIQTHYPVVIYISRENFRSIKSVIKTSNVKIKFYS